MEKKIVTLKEERIIDGGNNTIYPRTLISGVEDDNGKTLDKYLLQLKKEQGDRVVINGDVTNNS